MNEPLRASPDRLTGSRIEVGEVTVKCIASNIRPPMDWSSYSVVPGIGHEGNLVVVEAMADRGSTTLVENPYGRMERIYTGDRFVGVLANRHSGTSESGDVLEEGIELSEGKILHLLSRGGVVGEVSGIPARMGKEALPLKPLGLVAKDATPVNLEELCGGWHETLAPSAPIIVVSGTSAEVGKTTTSVGLIKTLKEQGIRVAGTKFAGTGRLGDILSLRDAGAHPWLDFPDVGLATTYTSAERFTPATYTLFNHINSGEPKPDIIIAEAGGDPIEANIPTFLSDQNLIQYVKGFVIVSGDVMGMMGTRDYLRQFTGDMPLYAAYPKDRNQVTTRDRVQTYLPGIPLFNSIDPRELRAIAADILQVAR